MAEVTNDFLNLLAIATVVVCLSIHSRQHRMPLGNFCILVNWVITQYCFIQLQLREAKVEQILVYCMSLPFMLQYFAK